MYDSNGNYIKEFSIYSENNKFYGPIITKTENECFIENESFLDYLFIAFDEELDFAPYNLYINGELSIYYLLNENKFVSNHPVIKCDIIESRNSLKLFETDSLYLYKPSKITEEVVDRWDQLVCYKMIFQIPSDYEIPNGLNFVFKEYCFGNQWSFTWKGDRWDGDQIKGRSNSKVISKIKKITTSNPFDKHGCYVRIKNDDWNKNLLKLMWAII